MSKMRPECDKVGDDYNVTIVSTSNVQTCGGKECLWVQISNAWRDEKGWEGLRKCQNELLYV